MRIHSVEIKNFRSISHLPLELDPFVCIIGHNNAGKSTLLMALTLFRSGSAIKSTDFYDPTNEVSIRVTFHGVTRDLLESLAPEHLDRISEIAKDDQLTLVRRYGIDGKSVLHCIQLLPKDPKKNPINLKASLKGIKGSPGLCEKLIEAYPDKKQDIESEKPTTQGGVLELASRFQRQLNDADLEEREAPLPTGIPASIEPLMPEILYIPAVKDLTDELKTKEASSFGKIIRVLLELVNDADELSNVRAAFSQLDQLLNRVVADSGEVTDGRLIDVKRIERCVQDFIREQFQSVSVEIEIPPPDLRTIFSSAKIYLHDGVRTDVEAKGDGLKRQCFFHFYVHLSPFRVSRASNGNGYSSRYLFLFEEPELYLHPNSQRVLYDALRQISTTHQVCVCTHSPYFFSASDTGTYVRLKKAAAESGRPPRCSSLSLNLSSELGFKDAFQIICFENSNAAFFCDRVLLVEGVCDVIYLKHLAKTLNPQWDFDRRNIAVVKVDGKGNFGRFRKFFSSFDVEVRIVADLDAVSDQFEQLDASPESSQLRTDLYQTISALSKSQAGSEITKSQAQDLIGKRTFMDKYKSCRDIAARISKGEMVEAEDLVLFGTLFDEEEKLRNRKILESDPRLNEAKQSLLASLRSEGIVVLSRGAIEAYYPSDITGGDKPTRAIAACRKVADSDAALKLCNSVQASDGSSQPELDLIFDCIFS